MVTLVVGAVRSGTSMVAGTLHHLGLPASAFPPIEDDWNPAGSYCDLEFEYLFLRMTNEPATDFSTDIGDLIARRHNAYPGGWTLKSHALLPFAAGFLPQVGPDVAIVHTVRARADCAASLRARRGDRGAPGFCDRYVDETADYAEHIFQTFRGPKLVVEFEELIDPAALVSRLSRFVGRISTPNARAFVRPEFVRFGPLASVETSSREPADRLGSRSLLVKAVTLAGAVTRHVVAGLPTLAPESIEARLAVCRACDRYDAERVVCRECGCRLMVKAAWADQSCPLGKWAAGA